MGFEFSSCYVRTRNIIGIAAQKWPHSDSLEQRDTALFFYYPDEPEGSESWAVRYLGETTGVHGCAAFKPNERWVFVTEDGESYVIGQGDDDWESPVVQMRSPIFSNVKAVRNGHAIAVGPNRKVFMRKAKNSWVPISRGLFPRGEDTNLEHAGFRDVDGFSEKDMYACGGLGDLWHYDGDIWGNIDVPTNSSLENVCCADDGIVYITTNRREILMGRGETWQLIRQELTDQVFESIVNYRGQVIVSTISKLFFADGGEFRFADLGVPEMKSRAHLAAGDGILVVAGNDEAVMYDGQAWSVILESAS
ncbi:hypothetical protein [Nitrospira sp. BLG_2]|uniref:hypothetical protein n=1 Tax=Nitrospira sp. BLG_2 TaxID=3397507 RepID=UPI003B9937BB